LLHYFVEGSKDPMQTRIYNELVISLYELNDKLLQRILLKESPQLFYSVKRALSVQNDHIAGLLNAANDAYCIDNLKDAEISINQLFKLIWTSDSLSENDCGLLRESLTVKADSITQGRSILNCQIVSALTLGLTGFFDKKKLLLLFDAAASEDEEVKIRAYIGIFLTFYMHQSRLPLYADVHNRLDTFTENWEYMKYVDVIFERFILTRDTEKISTQLRDEVIPEIMKLNPKFSPKINFEDITPEQLENGMNPEWLEQFANTKTGKKLEEFNRLQEEGSDVMHSSFIHLKSFPFFHEINNWFMPFVSDQISFLAANPVGKSLDLFKQIGLMCNSDLYSLYFGINLMPEESKMVMLSQLESQLGELNKQKKAELTTSYDRSEQIAGRYIQDLYRFFKLYSRRSEFFDFFNQRLDFYNIPMLKPYMENGQLFEFAELYLRKDYYRDAAELYEQIQESNSDNAMYYQKTGYCKQMSGDAEGALRDYYKAELLDSESKWLIRQMAKCYRTLKMSEKAIESYLHYERLDPDNISNLMSLGACYIETKNYAEALKYYFKVDYLDNEGQKALRPIAWCSFLLGKFDQARNYYHKIISHHPDSHDFMNAGHTEWVLQNLKGAIELYRKSIESVDNDFDKFYKEFVNDIPNLINAGIEQTEIPLVLDELKY
ncbi:MAG: tetratricopeptide repeat protein, partial [Tannerella sp.]|jgi:tetratricopeptide (TPR) repeat protein|nr:tetratricopeptide repeat protein [Tannerella sp.]